MEEEKNWKKGKFHSTDLLGYYSIESIKRKTKSKIISVNYKKTLTANKSVYIWHAYTFKKKIEIKINSRMMIVNFIQICITRSNSLF